MYILNEDLFFPPIEKADKFGVLAIGGDLSAERLTLAYKRGIFPWFNEDEPIIWWAPPQRMVLFPDEIKISKSMRNLLNRNVFEVTHNQDFEAVISNCSKIYRHDQNGSWITNAMMEAYCRLHEAGLAKSIEVWHEGKLAGGLYGIDLGHVFSGESMFSIFPNASKVAFIALAKKYELVDCQVHNDHLESLGCREIPRKEFMDILLKS
ncbi:leucyl/phenylalanyl-tRNA--protein transferase [Flavobacterium pallidum]|uniref:Leucyl/phenylalanyl-tRNA--protein transferase n=1 Tax=Flavobacterium pallidum TaxID=2172098 RepID=A0A2S1SEM8_9FLAO|nr:leucyl/phenylalanyl-tRNA--protein transferase [Flavobacterium pallidum]AWI24849.1 leucyl/phenylalanyl-tRNA--protein transferase [Flavobacterium pallidum]